jgi:hypothetical protein
MADWYASSIAYAALTQFAASHAYSVGDIVRPLTAPALGRAHAFRCTTAGTSSTEPTWPTGNNSTVTTGGATFTNVTGQSTYNWSAPAGDVYSITAGGSSNRAVVGDRVFLSSDHSENLSGNLQWTFGTAEAYGLIQIISVNRAGSVPPVAADVLKGAAITCTVATTQTMTLSAQTNLYWEGITFTLAGTPTTNGIISLQASHKSHYFKNCAFVLANTTGSGGGIGTGTGNTAKATFDNTTVQFALAAQFIGSLNTAFELTWINTPAAIQGATIPTNLFSAIAAADVANLITCRGVDLSAVTGTLVNVLAGTMFSKVLLDSCKIAAAVTRLATPGTASTAADEVELVNCYDGTNVINERFTAAGNVTTDRSTYLTGGAVDDIGNYSLKLVSSTRSDFATFPLDCFAFDVENTATGSSKTATIEIISSGTLNNNDIRLAFEYMGTSGNPIASYVDSLATILTAASALSSSSSTWNSPPSTPQKQLLQVTFTPQRAGRVRGLVRLGKVSTTVWVNPQIAIT